MKRFKRFLKGVLIVVLVLAVIHGIASMVLSRKVASKIAAIKAQGDPVSMAEMGKVDIPDSENGATVYLQIFKEIGKPIIYNEHGIPQLGGDKTKNYDYQELFLKKEITPEMRAKGEKSLATYQHALDIVDEAVSRPRCKFRTNWGDGFGALFPYYAPLRELSRMLMLDAQISARHGDMDKAVKRTGQIFKVSEAIKDDPILISHLVQIAIISIGLQNIRDIEQEGRINASQAKYLENILAKIDLDYSYLSAIKGERTLGIYSYNMIQENNIQSYWELNHLSGDKPPFYINILLHVIRPFVIIDEFVYLDYMSKQIHNANLLYIESPASKPGYDETSELPKYAIISRTIIPVYSRASQQRDIAKSSIRSARAFLGAIIYKDRFGEYPKSLGDLETRMGWKVEKDPLTGKEFHYKRQGEGFLLYGVGQNLRDDGGKYIRKRMTTPENMNYDDIVWERKN